MAVAYGIDPRAVRVLHGVHFLPMDEKYRGQEQ
jgi:hypothetical protein